MSDSHPSFYVPHIHGPGCLEGSGSPHAKAAPLFRYFSNYIMILKVHILHRNIFYQNRYIGGAVLVGRSTHLAKMGI